jgi:putative phosphoesterase
VRLAILADTHMPKGARRLPDLCLRECLAAEAIIHVGDFFAASVLEEIEAIGPPVVAVHGNVDDAELRSRLPAERLFEAAGVVVGLIHDAGPGRGRLARMRRHFPEADAVVFGHSHMPLHERDGAFQIFNPGSPTERRRAPHRSMGVATVESGSVRFEHVELGA